MRSDGIFAPAEMPFLFMPTGSAVSIEEYLTTSYRPDCDYVDGAVVERHLGEYDQARLQMAVSAYYFNRASEWGIWVVPEQRVQVSPTRYRVPDICVVTAKPTEQIFRTPPFICIEILSPEDRFSAVLERVQDYLKFGVPYVWILDPKTHKAHRCTSTGTEEVQELRTQDPATSIPIEALFTE